MALSDLAGPGQREDDPAWPGLIDHPGDGRPGPAGQAAPLVRGRQTFVSRGFYAGRPAVVLTAPRGSERPSLARF